MSNDPFKRPFGSVYRNKFTAADKELLFSILEEHEYFRQMIQTNSSKLNYKKSEMWQKVTEVFNERTGRKLVRNEVRKLYSNIQQKVRNEKGLTKKRQTNTSIEVRRSSRKPVKREFSGDEENDVSDDSDQEYITVNSVRIPKKKDGKFLPLQVKWVHHESCIGQAFRDMREEGENFDVTLVCSNDYQVDAHKVVLSACSSFFREILKKNQHPHPLLYLRGVRERELDSIMDYMYHGKTLVAQSELSDFLQVAGDLKIRGLVSDLITSSNSNKSRNFSEDKENTSRVPVRQSRGPPNSGIKAEETEVEEQWTEKTEEILPHEIEQEVDYDLTDVVEDEEEEDDEDDNEDAEDVEEMDDGDEVLESVVLNVTDTTDGAVQVANGTTLIATVSGSTLNIGPDNTATIIGTTTTSANSALSGSNQSYICKTCGQNFGNSAVALMVHQSREHALAALAAKCKICEKTFGGNDYLVAHMQSAHPEAEHEYNLGGDAQ